MLPYVSIGYVNYVHGIVSGPDAPLALALVFPSPCYGSALTYHTVVHQYSKTVLSLHTKLAHQYGGRGVALSPVGACAASHSLGARAASSRADPLSAAQVSSRR